MKKNGVWDDKDLENIKKNWPHLRNFDDSVLKNVSLKDLSNIGKNKGSLSKVLGNTMTENFENMKNFPAQIEAGTDDCLKNVHKARFLRGFVGDGQDLWLQAREHWGSEGMDPIKNYNMVSLGVGDLMTQKVWAEIHKPNSMALSIRMLSRKSVAENRRAPDKSDAPKEFEHMNELKAAMLTLENAIFRVTPWNMAFKTLNNFVYSNDFGESELGSRSAKMTLLADFVDEILQLNALNWEESKVYLSSQDLIMRWSTFWARNKIPAKSGEGNFKRKEGPHKGSGGGGERSPEPLLGSAKSSIQGTVESRTTNTPLLGILPSF
jgi:hypothetical protein